MAYKNAHPKRHLVCATISTLLFFVTGKTICVLVEYFSQCSIFRCCCRFLCCQIVSLSTTWSLWASIDTLKAIVIVVFGYICDCFVHLFNYRFVYFHSFNWSSLTTKGQNDKFLILLLLMLFSFSFSLTHSRQISNLYIMMCVSIGISSKYNLYNQKFLANMLFSHRMMNEIKQYPVILTESRRRIILSWVMFMSRHRS